MLLCLMPSGLGAAESLKGSLAGFASNLVSPRLVEYFLNESSSAESLALMKTARLLPLEAT